MFSFGLLQHNYLAQVTSNIWGTKFKIVGLATFLPTNLGAGNYPAECISIHSRFALHNIGLQDYGQSHNHDYFDQY